MDVNHLSVYNSSAVYQVAIQGILSSDRASQDRSISGYLSTESMILHENGSVRCSANSGCILGNGIQDRLNIRGRTGDDAQDFARGCLLFQRLLEFVEQAHILDSDHRLVCECFEQLDLRGCE